MGQRGHEFTRKQGDLEEGQLVGDLGSPAAASPRLGKKYGAPVVLAGVLSMAALGPSDSDLYPVHLLQLAFCKPWLSLQESPILVGRTEYTTWGAYPEPETTPPPQSVTQ